MRAIDRTVNALLALILLALVGVAFTAVVFRYVLGSALSWSFEASLILLTYLTFLGAFAALRQGAHLQVHVLVAALPLPLRAAAFVATQLIVLGICVVMTVWGTEQTLRFADDTTTMLNLPRGPIYAIVPVSGLAMALETVVRLVQGLRRLARGESPDPALEEAQPEQEL